MAEDGRLEKERREPCSISISININGKAALHAAKPRCGAAARVCMVDRHSSPRYLTFTFPTSLCSSCRAWEFSGSPTGNNRTRFGVAEGGDVVMIFDL